MIIVPDKPSPVVSYAAGELQHFLVKATGARPEIIAEKQAAGQHGFEPSLCYDPLAC